MKHSWPVTITLLALFLATQLLGLALIAKNMTVHQEGDRIVTYPPETAIGPPPETSPWETLGLIALGIVLGTLLILLLARLKKHNIWKLWYFLAAGLTISITIGAMTGEYTASIIAAFSLAWLKIFKPNPIVHNLTEVMIYPGIAILFYHSLSIAVMIILLLIISAYDIIAVFKSKHMITLAKFQTKSRVFAGLAIPKGKSIALPSNPGASKSSSRKTRSAILGGGDVAFPLLFSAVVLEKLVVSGMTKTAAFITASIIPITVTAALAVLFYMAKKDKFYPAMPAVTIGCLVGWALTMIL